MAAASYAHNKREVIDVERANLVVMLESDAQALQYFAHLPEDVRRKISENPEGISSLQALTNRAEYLMRQN